MGNQLNCLEQCRTHEEQRHRLLVLQQGGVFKRKKFLLGIPSGSEKIHLRLSGDEQFFIWKPHEGNKSASKIDVSIVGTVKVQGTTSFTIVSRKGEVLLDLEADDEEQRNVWVTNLQILCDDGEDTGEAIEAAQSGSKFRRMIEDRNKKQAYWAQRTQELEDRKQEAEERKKKFAGAGMKYTALAMSNRVPSAKSDD